ncbi:related to emopamil-binding protein [Phialocephala subalpina]|uniref:Related to emopamil-binding protein n=1 Tax=Phialocephala subalpina TaxID=576137 RepID=A0A1L7WHL9_9HELO|nr:related to emopamil-binding protein [Phialocephala subalpina]
MFSPALQQLSLNATHPYYPLNVSIPGYIANTTEPLALVSVFASSCALVFATTWLIVKNTRPSLSTSDFLTIIWFVMCGFIHLVIEGYYSYNFLTIASNTDLLAQMWKVYSLSDSRYLTQNAFVLSMESVTALFWGPLSFLVSYLILTDHQLRHPLQSVLSLGQLYGDVLYYATNIFDEWVYGWSYSRPEPEVFWGLYVGLNAVWMVIPSVLLFTSVRAGGRAFAALAKMEKLLATRKNGTVKKSMKSDQFF